MDGNKRNATGAISGNVIAPAWRLWNAFGAIKPIYFSNSAQGIYTGAKTKEPLNAYGPGIAQTAIQSIGMSTRDPCCSAHRRASDRRGHI
jgi:hypothetical protein